MSENPFNDELQRTAFQKKAAIRIAADDTLDLAITFFREHGYRANRTGRPGHMFVMGDREGTLPRVFGEISARDNVGKPGTTLVTVDAAGEKLGPLMGEFLAFLRAENQRRRDEQ